MSELFLGVDVGSSSTKGVLVRPDGEVLAEVERPHVIAHPRPGWAEQDPERDWWDGVVAVCRELLARRLGDVAAVGVSGLGPCVVAADAAGRPLRPAILYGIDTRATREIAALTDLFGSAEILARCGSPLTSQSAGPKLLWLARREPGVWAATRRFFTAGSWLVHRLTGEYVLDHHSASQCGPLYDVRENRWAGDWAAVVAPGLSLPRLAWAHETLGVLSADAAAATGLPQGIPVAAGTIDSWAEVAGSGLRGAGEALLVYGTTMFLIEVGTAAAPDPRLWSTTAFAPGERNLAAGLATAGALAVWMKGIAGDISFETLFEEAAAAGPGAGGLLALPYFNGERTPLFDPDARGLLLGLTTSHTRGHVTRALLEGAALAVRHNLDVMREAGAHIGALRASGGGARGRLWPQIVSDVTQLPQVRLAGHAGAAYGDALFAAVAAGAAGLDTVWVAATDRVVPDPGTAARYDDLYGLYLELYPATASHAHALAELQRQANALERDGAGRRDAMATAVPGWTYEVVVPPAARSARARAGTRRCSTLLWVDIRGAARAPLRPGDRRRRRVGGAAPDQPRPPAARWRRARRAARRALPSGRPRRSALVPLRPTCPRTAPTTGPAMPVDVCGSAPWRSTSVRPSAALYRVDADLRVTRVLGGTTISNGLGWSPDGRALLLHRQPHEAHRRVRLRPRDRRSGRAAAAGERREATRSPDGMAVDAEGCLWVALHGGWGLNRYSTARRAHAAKCACPSRR